MQPIGHNLCKVTKNILKTSILTLEIIWETALTSKNSAFVKIAAR